MIKEFFFSRPLCVFFLLRRRDSVFAFIQADVHARGWLDPNEAPALVSPAMGQNLRYLFGDDYPILKAKNSLGTLPITLGTLGQKSSILKANMGCSLGYRGPTAK